MTHVALRGARPLTQKRLQELLDYNPDTDTFVWRRFRSKGAKAGDIAKAKTSRGKPCIRIDGVRYMASRLAYFYRTGKWPSGRVIGGEIKSISSCAVALHIYLVAGLFGVRVERNGIRHNLGRYRRLCDAIAVRNKFFRAV